MPEADRYFSVACILSIYHNRLLVSFPELRELLDYMTGAEVPLWQIPEARALCMVALERQYPGLTRIEPPPGFKNDAMHAGRFIKAATKQLGGQDRLLVRRLPPTAFKVKKYARCALRGHPDLR